MKFQINDVGHGFCAFAIAENGNCALFDCGHKTDPENRPSVFLPKAGCRSVELLVVTNYDEDHISDLPRLRGTLPIAFLLRNQPMTADQLRQIKLQSGPITEAMASLLGMIAEYTGKPANPPSLPGIEWTSYGNTYPTDFQDTNNLSLATFLRMGRLSVVIPGDLETPGWETLLRIKAFQEQLSGVNVFVASHHGRDGGYCEDVFKYCHPDVILFSDGPVQYETQDMSGTYGKHAKGITFNGELRKVLSTRSDGTLSWSV